MKLSSVNLLQTVDPYIGRYYSAAWVRKNILQMSDEVVDEMDKQIAQEEKDGTGGPTMPVPGQEPPQATTEEYPPEDNTVDDNASESKTPMLDSEVEKFSARLNRK